MEPPGSDEAPPQVYHVTRQHLVFATLGGHRELSLADNRNLRCNLVRLV